MERAVYVHIPFCEQRCHYCAFVVDVAPRSHWKPYVDRVLREADLAALTPRSTTLYLGGGTPSLLDFEDIARLTSRLGTGASEVTLEANPGTLTGDKLSAYRDSGVNRISLGAQSFSDDDLKRAGRLHRASESITDFERLRHAGFDNVSVDLIAGLRGQLRSTWTDNLNWIGRLRPDHVSVYLLDREEQSSWGTLPADVPEDDDLEWFYNEAMTRLGELGYRHYEISNWALPGRESRHNLNYWRGGVYDGIGVGAHSCSDGRRYWNTRSLVEYAEAIGADRRPTAGFEELTHEIQVEEAFLLGLRQIDGMNIREVADRLGVHYTSTWFERLEDLRSSGLVEFDGTNLRLGQKGWLLANSIIEDILWPNLLSTSEATQ